MTMLPIGMVAVVFVVINCVSNRGRNARASARIGVVSLTTVFLFVQPSVLQSILALFACVKVGDESYLQADMDVSCSSPNCKHATHTTLQCDMCISFIDISSQIHGGNTVNLIK